MDGRVAKFKLHKVFFFQPFTAGRALGMIPKVLEGTFCKGKIPSVRNNCKRCLDHAHSLYAGGGTKFGRLPTLAIDTIAFAHEEGGAQFFVATETFDGSLRSLMTR